RLGHVEQQQLPSVVRERDRVTPVVGGQLVLDGLAGSPGSSAVPLEPVMDQHATVGGDVVHVGGAGHAGHLAGAAVQAYPPQAPPPPHQGAAPEGPEPRPRRVSWGSPPRNEGACPSRSTMVIPGGETTAPFPPRGHTRTANPAPATPIPRTTVRPNGNSSCIS